MGGLRRFFSNWWVLTILAALLIALFLILALPIFLKPFRPLWVRLVIALVVALVWAGFALWRVLSARKASEAIAQELAKPEPGQAEADALAKRMRDALAGLKKASGDKRDYLYAKPWYVIIGPPGAGKTTALLNSGLRFPFSDTALKGVGGTRNLDFWFADEAVLVDTAGRYTTQDSDQAADSRAWESFLGLLRKNRPLQPINGVLVAIGLDELMRADRAQLDAHASAVRRRLAELRRTLEITAPVYILFTKADLLAGFTEFFEDLDVEGRRSVLGVTFPWPNPNLTPEKLVQEFDEVAQAVADRMSKRLQDELDPRRRSLILGFPAQVAALRARVLRFLDGAFPVEGGERPALRGLYFTSGVQEGTPLDRILSGIAAVYDAPQTAARGQGRAYFLNRLLNEVVFAEAGLVQSDPKARARRAAMLTGGLAGIGAVFVIVVLIWIMSFFQNRALQNRLLASAQNAAQEIHDSGVDLVEVRSTDPDLEQSLSILRALRELPRGYAAQKKGSPPLSMRFGLFQSGEAEEAKQAYLEALQRIMLPRVLLRLEQYMQENKAQPLALYPALKTYLMLGGQGPLDPKAVKSWVEADWESGAYPGPDRSALRTELAQHLDAMLADPQLGRVWPNRQAPLDGALIDSTRAAVQTLSLADRAYAILKQKAAESGAPGWRADTVLASGDARAFSNGDAVLHLTVPYFFTRPGFERAYQLGLQTVQSDLQKDLWVMGPDVNKTAIQTQIEAVRPGVAALYAKDYIAAWDGVIKTPQAADYFHDPAALGALTRVPSPLKLLLLEVRKNTTFGGGASGAGAGLMRGLQSRMGTLGGAVVSGAVSSNTSDIDAGKQIESYFKPVDDYVGDGKSPAPIDDFLNALKNAGSANAAASVAGGGLGGAAAQGQLATAIGAVATSAVSAPPQLQAFVAQATQSGKGAAVSSAHGAIADDYQRNLLPACQSVTENRYPFFGAAPNDAATADLLRVFGVNGQIDSFVRDRLAPLMDTSGPVWRWRASDPVASTFDPTTAEAFQKAAQIRDLLASGLPVKVEAAGLGGAVNAAEFASGGATYRFEATSIGAQPVMWSVSGGLPEAHVALFAGKQQLVKRFDAQGPFALFRLMDQARKENAGPTAIKATFGQGAQFATFKVDLPSDKNPFSRGGLWSFRCPAKL